MYLVPCLTSIWSDDKALPVNIYTPPIIDRKFQHLTSTGLSQNNHNVKGQHHKTSSLPSQRTYIIT